MYLDSTIHRLDGSPGGPQAWELLSVDLLAESVKGKAEGYVVETCVY